MSKLVCDIVNPEARLYSEEAYMVVVPGVEGEMGFLYDHEPLVSALADGIVRLQKDKDGEMTLFALQGGYVEVTGRKVIILADRALSIDDIDVAAAKSELADLEKKKAELSEEELSKTTVEADIVWCKLQIRTSEK